MSIEENIAIVRRWYDETYNRKNMAAAEELMDPSFVGHLHDNADRSSYVRSQSSGNQRIPDLSATIEDVVAQGDKVVVRATYRGTLKGEWTTPWGSVVSPGGKQCRWTEINIIRVAGGKVMEDWSSVETDPIWRQVGALSTPGQAAT